MAVVAIMVVEEPALGERESVMWQGGVWTATPVLTGGTWRWVVELRRRRRVVARRTVRWIAGV